MTARGRRNELRSSKIGKKGGFLRIAQELRRISGHGFQDSVAFVDARILKKKSMKRCLLVAEILLMGN